METDPAAPISDNGVSDEQFNQMLGGEETPEAAPAASGTSQQSAPSPPSQPLTSTQPSVAAPQTNEVPDEEFNRMLNEGEEGAARHQPQQPYGWSTPNNPVTAAGSATQRMLLGNIPNSIAEATQGLIHDTFGIGPSREQAQNILEQRSAELTARYPKSTLVGDALGVAGLVGTGMAAEGAATKGFLGPTLSALASKGVWGKAAVSSLISGGMSAFMGGSQGEGLEGRLKEAGKGGLLGLATGAVGSLLGSGISKVAGKTVTPAAKEAAEHFGLETHEPLSAQGPQVAEAAQSIVPNTPGSLKDVGQGLKAHLINALHEANLPAAYLSDAGANSITLDIAKSWQAQRPYASINDLSGNAAKAWNAVKNFKNATAYNGQATLQDAINLKKEVNAHYNVKDADYMTVWRAVDDWFNGVINSHAFSNDPAADKAIKAAVENYQSLYRFGTHIENNAVGKIINHALPTSQITDWANNMGRNNLGQEAANVLERLEGIKGEGSEWWKQLQTLMINKIAAPAAAKNGADLAARLQGYAKSPIGLAMHGQTDTARLLDLADAVGAMPNKAQHAGAGHAGHGLGFIGGAIAGWEHGGEHEDVVSRLTNAVKYGMVGAAALHVGQAGMPFLKTAAAKSAPLTGSAVRWGTSLAAPVIKNLGAQYSAPHHEGSGGSVDSSGMHKVRSIKQQSNNIKDAQQNTSMNQGIASTNSGYRQPKKPYPPSEEHKKSNHEQGGNEERQGVHNTSPSVLRALNVARQYRQEGGVTPDLSDPMVGQAPDTMKQMHAPDFSSENFAKTNMGQTVQALALPHDVYRGQVDPTSDEAIGKAFTLVSKYRR